MGTGEATSSPVAVFRLGGHVPIGPSGVDDQSNDRISRAISPGPDKKLAALGMVRWMVLCKSGLKQRRNYTTRNRAKKSQLALPDVKPNPQPDTARRPCAAGERPARASLPKCHYCCSQRPCFARPGGQKFPPFLRTPRGTSSLDQRSSARRRSSLRSESSDKRWVDPVSTCSSSTRRRLNSPSSGERSANRRRRLSSSSRQFQSLCSHRSRHLGRSRYQGRSE